MSDRVDYVVFMHVFTPVLRGRPIGRITRLVRRSVGPLAEMLSTRDRFPYKATVNDKPLTGNVLSVCAFGGLLFCKPLCMLISDTDRLVSLIMAECVCPSARLCVCNQ